MLPLNLLVQPTKNRRVALICRHDSEGAIVVPILGKNHVSELLRERRFSDETTGLFLESLTSSSWLPARSGQPLAKLIIRSHSAAVITEAVGRARGTSDINLDTAPSRVDFIFDFPEQKIAEGLTVFTENGVHRVVVYFSKRQLADLRSEAIEFGSDKKPWKDLMLNGAFTKLPDVTGQPAIELPRGAAEVIGIALRATKDTLLSKAS